jgi:hypothetical protein
VVPTDGDEPEDSDAAQEKALEVGEQEWTDFAASAKRDCGTARTAPGGTISTASG